MIQPSFTDALLEIFSGRKDLLARQGPGPRAWGGGGILLVGKADGEGVGRGDEQTHRGDQHFQTSRTCHVPLATLGVVLQNALVSFQDPFL